MSFQNRFTELDVIYMTQTVRITKCIDLKTNQTVCVKSLKVSNTEDVNYFLREIVTLYSLSHFKFFIKILDYLLEGTGKEINTIKIVTAYYSKGDLSKELTRRKATNEFFSDPVLKLHFETLLHGFAKLQEINFSHRDIKPENIFIDEKNSLVIGDLGSVANKVEEEMTLVGSHIYMSPEMRNSFSNFNKGYTGPRVNYNPLKSDVWSLGITFMYMITLVKPELTDLNKIEQSLNFELNRIRSPLFRTLLGKMLKLFPDEREDFVTLEKWFSSQIAEEAKFKGRNSMIYSSVQPDSPQHIFTEPADNRFECKICKIADSRIKCTNCDFAAHVDCLEDKIFVCDSCGANLDIESNKARCSKCFNLFAGKSLNRECKHRLCLLCKGSRFDCEHCTSFKFNGNKPEAVDGLPTLMCPSCGKSMEIRGKALVCVDHPSYRICVVCKLAEHPGSCLESNKSEQVYCLRCRNYTKKDPFSFAVNCTECKSNYCYVCLKSMNQASHKKCANLFTWG